MKKTKEITKKVKEEVTIKILCNGCKKDLTNEWDYFSCYYDFGFCRHDGKSLEIDLCCSCLDTVIDKLKIDPWL